MNFSDSTADFDPTHELQKGKSQMHSKNKKKYFHQ